ncbi:MAG: nuclear transport factor 2 family protein [Pseudomonadota bacterium]
MTNREIARAYLRCFCEGDVGGLAPLLAPDLSFTGTTHTYHSAEAYLRSLRADPPEKCACRLLSLTEDGDSVAVFYEYVKPEHVMTIAQLFEVRNQQINKILLVFDGRGFT